MRQRLVMLLCMAATLWACGGPATPGPAKAMVVDPNLAPNFRLGQASAPTSYQLRLQIDPEEVQFRGEVTIFVELALPLHTLWLHQKDLHITSATFVRAGKSLPLAAIASEEDAELLGLVATEELAAGSGQVQIQFEGELGSMQALFRQRQDDRWYAYSDFEASDARAAFPCYDEPRFKVPWNIEVVAPADSLAFANTPQIAREPQADGSVLFRFAETSALPSYLVALAVGPFDFIAGKASSTPLRVIAPKGLAEDGRFVLENAARWIRFLETYLDTPLPFPKLDFIAVPRFGGAMENPGLVTFSAGILLTPPGANAGQLRRAAGVTSHELAHMWFGNLITPAHWNDLWLNEGFATWLSDKVVADWQPAEARDVLDIADKSTAYEIDHRVGARIVRQPVQSREDIREAFDAITYRKGGALLTMLESWLGPETMRAAVRSYLRRGKGGSVVAADLVSALRAAAPKKKVAKILKSYLTQAGIPQVEATLHCDDKITVELEQSRYLPIAERALATAEDLDTRWAIPVCLRYPSEAGLTSECLLLDKGHLRHALRTKRCPAWILPNHLETGYYHYRLGDAGFQALASAALDPRETLGLVHNLVAALQAGQLSVASALDRLEGFAPEGSLAIQQAVIPLLYQLEQSVVGSGERAGFSARIRSWYQGRLARLGLEARRGEPAEHRELRPVLIHLLAELGDDAALQTRARSIVSAWLARPVPMDMQLLDSLLQAAAVHGDEDLAKQYWTLMQATKDGRHTAVLFGAVHAFADPKILKNALHESIPDRLDLPNLMPVLMRVIANPSLRTLLIDKLLASREALLASGSKDQSQGPEDAAAGGKDITQLRQQNFERAAQLFAGLCDSEGKAAAQRFAGDEFNAQPMLDAIAGCMAFRAATQKSAAAAFAPASATSPPAP